MHSLISVNSYSGVLSVTSRSAAADQPLAPGTCPADPSKPLLEPEAPQTTHTAYTNPDLPQAQNIVDGKGVTDAWIADGMDPHNPDFMRADGAPVFTDYQDFSGTDPNGPQPGEEPSVTPVPLRHRAA